MKNILVLSSSLRKGSNSEILAQEFVKGAADAGNKVEFVSLRGKKIAFCTGCLGCQKKGRCVIKDDANEIAEKMKSADVIAFATPIYYYEMSGQLKTMLDRANSLYVSDYKFREIYLLATAADTDKKAMNIAKRGISGWIACFEGVKFKGGICGTGAEAAGDVKKMPLLLKRVYTMGKKFNNEDTQMKTFQKIATTAVAILAFGTLTACCPEKEQTTSNAQQAAAAPAVQPAEPAKDNNMNKLTLTAEWDKVFPKSEKVEHSKVTFKNHFGIELAADLYVPKDMSLKANGKFPAIAVSGPFGAIKEQSSGLYAQHMAERGFLTIAFDPSFTGESGGEPRYMNSPDINTEDFMASVDFLSTRDDVNPERIGIIGICGWGGMAINAAAIDTRVKATVASTMYDMSRVAANGYFDQANNAKARNEMRKALMAQRTKEYKTKEYDLSEVNTLPADDAPFFLKDYYDYYKTPRGYHKRSLNSNTGWIKSAGTSLLNTKLLAYANEIESAVLVIHGEKAHSRYFSEGAFEKMTGKKVKVPAKLDPAKNWNMTVGNKELMILPGAVHTDLYDDVNGRIPYDKMEEFFKANLK